MSDYIKNLMSSITKSSSKNNKKSEVAKKSLKPIKPPKKPKTKIKDAKWYRKKLGVKLYMNDKDILEVYVHTKTDNETLSNMEVWLDGKLKFNPETKTTYFKSSQDGSIFEFKLDTVLIKTNGLQFNYLAPEEAKDLEVLIENKNFTQIEPPPKKTKNKYEIEPYEAGDGPESIACPHECYRCQHLYPEIPDFYGYTKKGRKKEFGKKFDCIGEEGCPAIKIQLEKQKYTKDEVHSVVNNLVIGKDVAPIYEFINSMTPTKEDSDVDKKKYYRLHDDISWELFFQTAQSNPEFLKKYQDLIK